MTVHRVVMIGSFPPPVGGAALVNQMVLDALRTRDVEAMPLDVSGPALAHTRSIAHHRQRLAANLRVGRAARQLAGKEHTLYLVPDGGAGAWYSAGLARAAAGAFGHIVIHHHSCRYIEEHSRPIAALTGQTRAHATHVFLTEGMASSFARRYGAVRVQVATNARFVVEEAAAPLAPAGPGALRIGHLSNLCADKGFFTVADTFDALRTAGCDVTLLLAGPVLEEGVAARIADLRSRHGERVTHAGSVSGVAKRDVYRNIDLFLFPTQFRQEAAPLVIYEALAAGVPVLATDRGVIAELVAGAAGAVSSRDADYPAFVAGWIARHAGTFGERRTRAEAIKRDIRDACTTSEQQYDALLTLLSKSGVNA